MKRSSHVPPRGRRIWAALVASAGALTLARVTPAGECSWIGGSGWWDNPANWSPPSQPGAGDNAWVSQSDATNRLVRYYNTLSPNPILHLVAVNATGAGTIELWMNPYSHPLNTDLIYAGYDGRGHFIQDVGTVTVGQILVGYLPSGLGTYSLNGGAIGSAVVTVGGFGAGTFQQTGGYHWLTDNLTLGNSSGSRGYVSFSGGIWDASTAAAAIGYKSTATSEFAHSGGTFTVGTLMIGGTYNSRGRYALGSGGTLTVLGDETIGVNDGSSGTFDQTDGRHVVQGLLTIGHMPTASGTFNLGGGRLIVESERVGFTGEARFTHTGGRHNVYTTLSIGHSSGSQAVYDIHGSGTLNVPSLHVAGSATYGGGGFGTLLVGTSGTGAMVEVANDLVIHETGTVSIGSGGIVRVSSIDSPSPNAEGLAVGLGGGVGSVTLKGNLLTSAQSVGASGAGSLFHTSGANSTSVLWVGQAAGSHGTYALSGTGNVSASTLEYIGLDGSGTFLQDGGAHVSSNLHLAENPSSRGTYRMSDGTLGGGYLVIANDANAIGTFNQNGGAVTMTGLYLAGFQGSARGLYELNSGVLDVAGEVIVGHVGMGTITQAGGTHTIGSELILANLPGSSGSYLKTGGDLAVVRVQNRGTFTHAGGTLSVAQSFANSGTATIGGEQRWTSGALFDAVGGVAQFNTDAGRHGRSLIVNASGGNVVFNSDQRLLRLTLAAAAPPASPPVRVSPGGNHVVNTNEFAIQGGPAAPVARMDLADNDMVIDYASGGASPIDDVRQLIGRAYAGSAWNGNGLGSSLADSSHFALGYGESSTVLGPTGGDFAGYRIDGSAVLIAYTRYGDSDLNSVVNLADFNRLATHFGQAARHWTEGDFNYDGVVNLSDFNRLAANFGLSAGSDGVVDPADWAVLAAAVPEPAVGTLISGLCLTTLLRRREPTRRRSGRARAGHEVASGKGCS
jgi:hypothetical protein